LVAALQYGHRYILENIANKTYQVVKASFVKTARQADILTFVRAEPSL
jgi:hypothetical protein